MKVKRYVVNALPEALPLIRSELGVDAVILNTKEIRVGGFLGMFGKKKTEVIAAAETNGAAPAKPAARPAAAAQKPAITPEVIASMAASLSAAAAGRENTRETVAVGSAPSAAPLSRAAIPSASATAITLPTEQPPERQFAQPPERPAMSGPGAVYAARTGGAAPSSPTSAAAAVATVSGPSKKPVSDDALLDEIRDMKQWIMRMSKQQQLASRTEAVQALFERLEEQEVGPEWTDKLINAVETELETNLAGQPAEEPDRDTVWSIAGRILLEWLRDFEDGHIRRDTRVIHFVGPTGVGKTTSIAKLAAEQTLKAGRKVGFITSDTYRIAAVDQLRTYATILNVPLEVVFSPAEVARAFKELEDRELIFMDTAGRNFRNELYVSEVNSLLQSGSNAETFLVLSLTGKFSDMSKVAGNFAKFGIKRVLYTKQDETNAIGSILNLALEHGLTPTFIAHGQTVPDDIAVFQASRYVAQLLGDPHE